MSRSDCGATGSPLRGCRVRDRVMLTHLFPVSAALNRSPHVDPKTDRPVVEKRREIHHLYHKVIVCINSSSLSFFLYEEDLPKSLNISD